MDQQTAEQSGAETPKAEDTAPQDGEAVETLEEPKLREQMMLAAAAGPPGHRPPGALRYAP